MSPAEAEVLVGMLESDPCALSIKLKALKLAAATTGSVQKINFRDREVWFNPSKDEKAIDDLIRQADEACARRSGKASQFAITLGGGRRSLRDPFRT